MEEIIMYIAPTIAGIFTAVGIPLTIKVFTKKIIVKFIDDQDKRIENHDKEILERLNNIDDNITEMRGRVPKRRSKNENIVKKL